MFLASTVSDEAPQMVPAGASDRGAMGMLTPPQLKAIRAMKRLSNEASFEALVQLGKTLCVMQAVMNSAITFATEATEEGTASDQVAAASPVSLLNAIATWCAVGAVGFGLMTLGERLRNHAPLAVHVCLTLIFVSVLTSRCYATLDTVRIICTQAAPHLEDLSEACTESAMEWQRTLLLQTGFVLKVLVACLPLCCSLAAISKLQGEHALLTLLAMQADEAAPGGSMEQMQPRRPHWSRSNSFTGPPGSLAPHAAADGRASSNGGRRDSAADVSPSAPATAPPSRKAPNLL